MSRGCCLSGFRAAGLALSCYFSKPDWHCADYWRPVGGGVAQGGGRRRARSGRRRGQPPGRPTRNPDVRPARGTGALGALRRFHAPADSGAADRLRANRRALAGWWVGCDRRSRTFRWTGSSRRPRARQPGLIVVDRTVGRAARKCAGRRSSRFRRSRSRACGRRAWTVGTSFAYKPNDEYKTRAAARCAAGGRGEQGREPAAGGLVRTSTARCRQKPSSGCAGSDSGWRFTARRFSGTRCAAEPGTGTAALPFQQNDAALGGPLHAPG